MRETQESQVRLCVIDRNAGLRARRNVDGFEHIHDEVSAFNVHVAPVEGPDDITSHMNSEDV